LVDPIYRSEVNRDVPPARPGEFAPIRIGPLPIWPPVVLAPMAGVTNIPFRTLCRRFGAGLYVSEMITARPLVEGNRKTLHLASFAPDEQTRSLQLYGVDPYYVGEAVKRLVGEGHVDHIDMNFGCPVRKVTRRGGGAAIPAKPRLLRRIVHCAVASAQHVPVTIKFRMGINERYRTDLETGRIAEGEGCAAVALHARTAAQLYDGEARWEAIAALKQTVRSIPVLGNGDIWEAEDALRMMRTTGCDGVVVGRGCLGRPWLFRDLAQVFEGRAAPNPPALGPIVDIMREHLALLCAWAGEVHGVRMFRKHAAWYTKGFRGSARVRTQVMTSATADELLAALDQLDRDERFPPTAIRVPRGKTGGTQCVALPAGYLDDLDDDTPPCPMAEDATSGG
jgi:nifR3 family TIM-barrel protein